MSIGNKLKISVGGVADKPEVREWTNLEGSAIDDALNDFAWDMRGSDDIHATAQHRRELVRHLGRHVIDNLSRKKEY